MRSTHLFKYASSESLTSGAFLLSCMVGKESSTFWRVDSRTCSLTPCWRASSFTPSNHLVSSSDLPSFPLLWTLCTCICQRPASSWSCAFWNSDTSTIAMLNQMAFFSSSHVSSVHSQGYEILEWSPICGFRVYLFTLGRLIGTTDFGREGWSLGGTLIAHK